ncbi:uncharacterized protein LOC144802527 [Lissotriton helveticus]
MGRRRAPGKKVTAQCSRESVRATFPSLPLHDVSASRSLNDAQRNQDLEPLSANLPHIILLSLLEELEAKLDNLLNTLEDVPSRVAGLIKKIWIEKDQGSLHNGGVSLEMVCPASIRDCAVRWSPATPQPDRPGGPSLFLQSDFSDGHAPKQDCMLSSLTDVQVHLEEPSLFLQPMFPDRRHPQQDQCMQPGFPDNNVLQQDCTVSRCPQTDPPGRSLGAKLYIQPKFVDCQTPQQDHSMQSVFQEEREPDVHLKQEPSPLSANSWDQQWNLCPRPLLPERHKPQKNHCIQPTSPGGKEPDDPLEEELMCFDCQDSQENHSLQPVSPDGMSSDEHIEFVLLSFDRLGSQHTQCLQQHLCLQQELSYAQDPKVNYELESMRPEAQEPDQNDNPEPACTDAHGLDQKYKLEPLHTAAQNREVESVLPEAHEPDQNNTVEPLHPEEQDSNQNYKLETPCTDAQGSDKNNKLELLHTAAQDQELKSKRTEAQEPDESYTVKPLHPEEQDSNLNYKLETPCTDAQGLELNNKLEVLHHEEQDSNQNYKLLHPESQHQHRNCKPDLLCPDERGQSVPPSCLELDTNTADEDSMKRGNTKSHLLLFKATPGSSKRWSTPVPSAKESVVVLLPGKLKDRPPRHSDAKQSHLESLNGTESHRESGGKMNFTEKIYFGKCCRMQKRERHFACNVCEKRFNNKALLVSHKKVHELHASLRPYPCKKCKKCFTQKAIFLQHLRTHIGERPYQCTVCEKSFNQKRFLHQHQRIHTGEKPYSCTVCSKRFTHKGTLVRHQIVHTGERPYHCILCEKSFNQKSSLLQHQIIHTGEKPYSCAVCSRCFAHKGSLARHQSVHTGERPHHCTVCSKGFSDKGTLVRHKSVHSEEKPYCCTECEKSFPRKSALLQHQRTHTQERL